MVQLAEGGARERKGRTKTTVAKADSVAFVKAVVTDGSTLHADEASHSR